MEPSPAISELKSLFLSSSVSVSLSACHCVSPSVSRDDTSLINIAKDYIIFFVVGRPIFQLPLFPACSFQRGEDVIYLWR